MGGEPPRRQEYHRPPEARMGYNLPGGALGGWCLPRSSKPLSGAGCGVGGGFDSHALPPCSTESFTLDSSGFACYSQYADCSSSFLPGTWKLLSKETP